MSPSFSDPIPFAAPRPSACPGLLRIVPALDGGICRVKLACGQLSMTQALAIADAAERCGSGVIEITNRANLQIRGVRSDCADELITALLDAGLGPRSAAADDVRNLLVSPAAGIDVAALLDVAPLAKAILDLLQTRPRFQQLSPKFALLLDGGEALAMLDHPHDLWLSALPGATPRFAFGLAGCPAPAAALGVVAAEQVPALVEAVLNVFLDLATPEQTRMRQLLQSVPASDVLRAIGAHLPFTLNRHVGGWRRAPRAAHIGVYPQRQPELSYVGAVPPLGRLTAAQLRELARIAATDGDGSLRMTPWQSLLLPNIPDSATAIVSNELQRLGLSVRSDDSLAHLIACTGSAACAKGLADTKADGLQLAELLQAQALYRDVHLSGCARSCTAAHIAPYTLLAVAPARYDLFQRDPTSAIRSATHSSRRHFGRLLASAITIEQAAALLAEQPSSVDSPDD